MLQIKDIRKEYNTGGLKQTALDGVSLNFRDNEFVAILGPSGSGKTTLLNIVGGLDRYDSGDLIINGISTKQYKDRDWDAYRNHTIGFVFQSYNLIPHQTVLANVELALTISGISRSERRKRATSALEKVGLSDHIHKLPSQMSGGQMQRVAIARALVNDPDILLADEPTGALDSDTSVQVMDLLKEVASDRLVIMVTHNPELAEQYATRIVNLRDGQIISDSDPFFTDASDDIMPVHKSPGKSSMSFLTALQLSFNNLLTKKARTILVAFAGSIGIIGIALILSMSNGANKYIADIEENTLSEYPIEITSTGFSLASMMGFMDNPEEDEDTVTEIKTITSVLSKMSSNDLAALKHYLESGKSDIDQYAKHILYRYDITPLIYREDKGKIKQVNPYSVLSSFDNGMSSIYGSFSSFSMSMTNLFHEMPDNSDLYMSQYDVMAGHWPENYNECILVLTENNLVSDLALFAMGLKDDSKLEEAVKNYQAGGELSMEEDENDKPSTFNYDDFIGIKFRMINACDYYTYDSKYKIWTNKSDNTEFMKKLYDKAEELTIVGVVRSSENANSAMLNAGINYPYDLTTHIIDYSAESGIVKAQLKDQATDVLSGDPFGEKDNTAPDLSALFTIDSESIENAFSINTDSFDLSGIPTDTSSLESIPLDSLFSQSFSSDGPSLDDIDLKDISLEDLFKNMDMSDIDLGDMNLEELLSSGNLADALPDITKEDMIGLLKTIKVNINREDITTSVSLLTEGFAEYTKNNPSADISKLPDAISSFLATDTARTVITDGLRKIISDFSSDMITNEDLQSISDQIAAGYSSWAEANSISDPENYSAHLSDYLSSGSVLQILRNGLTSILQRAANNVDQADLSRISDELSKAYDTYAKNNSLPDMENIKTALNDYLRSEEAEKIITEHILNKIDTSELEKQVNDAVSEMASSYTMMIEDAFVKMITSYSDKIQDALSGEISKFAESLSSLLGKAISSRISEVMDALTAGIQSSLMSYLGGGMQTYLEDIASQFENAFSIDADVFKNAIKMNTDEDELTDLMMSMFSNESSSYDKNLKAFGYAELAKPYEILIYPKDFESKDAISEILDDYNHQMEESGQEEKIITYTDMVGTLMSSVTTIVNAISYILIAFVSISLVVSSIMIGVITYISVLERRKEIGILRSIGASKRNISNVFNAETIITGLLAGILGTGITLLLLIPGNIILQTLSGQSNLAAFLPLSSAGLLILLSVVLTLIGGLIPSRKAANSDPVSALRNE